MDIAHIMKILPHRYPFLLVDRILELVPREKIVGLKNVTINEHFFQGHFPGHPVMPGVLILESMAQVAGILAFSGEGTVEEIENNMKDKVIYFMSIDKVKFRRPVVPGDQLRQEIVQTRHRGTIASFEGKAYVGEDLVAEAQMKAILVDRETERD
ncbi:MAG: 3-hydroxyacyl-ACP dehydratase FabZ [bacterium]|nr:3-hydroxyacyl-ACP dehydratase FabZ [bacterium]MDT8365311.1 3-hydroxyacyl-ACP dehydratase FabZ [bacterium]